MTSSTRPRRARSSRTSPASARCSRPEGRAHERGEPLMQTHAPSIGRILVAVGFALSCFGLLLFLWVTFGGPIPLKPKSYQITADFPEATTLAVESDVRIGG